MKHLLIFLLAILSACLPDTDSTPVFKNKMFYGDWQPSNLNDERLTGIMTIIPGQILYLKSKYSPVEDCPYLIEETDTAVMLECYINDQYSKKKVYRIFELYEDPYPFYKNRIYIKDKFCQNYDKNASSLSIAHFKGKCSYGYRFKYINPPR